MQSNNNLPQQQDAVLNILTTELCERKENGQDTRPVVQSINKLLKGVSKPTTISQQKKQ